MRPAIVAVSGVVLSLGLLVAPAAAACPADSVQSGPVCIDKYEASVWLVASSQSALISKIQKGTVTLANLQNAGAVQLGLVEGDVAGNGCPATGNGCRNVYAVSIAGVTPSRFMTWFQAAAAARNSGKRLPTNQEWQVAALGTPDPGTADDGSTTCATNSGLGGLSATGSRSGCVSDVGAFDMVGNVAERVADWGDLANGCQNWPTDFGDDESCVGGPGLGYSNLPGAMNRGGIWLEGATAGVFTIETFAPPLSPGGAGGFFIGFRCAR